MNARGGWLSENELVMALKLPRMIETGLGGHDASLLLCVAAMLLYLGVVKEMSSCHLEGQRMAPSSIGNACSDVACQSMAMLLFASGKMASGRVANAAQWDVSTASQWGTSCVMAHSAALAGAGSVR